MQTISDLLSNPDLATITPQLDISTISLHQLSRIEDLNDVSSTKVLDGISKVHLSQKQQELRVLSSEERDVVHWLFPLEFYSKRKDALSRRQEGTSRWLLDTVEFQE